MWKTKSHFRFFVFIFLKKIETTFTYKSIALIIDSRKKKDESLYSVAYSNGNCQIYDG